MASVFPQSRTYLGVEALVGADRLAKSMAWHASGSLLTLAALQIWGVLTLINLRYVSLIGRINYSYDNRYIATFTLRRDATSRFINDKWGTFLSGALAWNIDSERFMQNQNTVSALKLRLSLGEVGNSNVPTSGSYSQLYGTNYSFGTIETIGQSSLSIANENLSWETTREVNAGLEVGLWNDRLKFTADFYDKVTRDLLLEAPVVNIVGFDKAWQNIGKMRNRGS